MQRVLRTCVFGGDNATTDDMRRSVGNLSHLQVVSLAHSWEEVRDCLNSMPVDLLVVNLDPMLDEALTVIQLIVRMAPDMGIIGVSRDTGPQTIIKAMRAGCAQFVCSPIDAQDLSNAIGRIQATRLSAANTSRRICVIGAGGGDGATIVSCNLALELASLSEKPVVLVDLNLEFGNVACAFDCKPKYSVADLCRGDVELDRTIVESAIESLPCNVHLLARPERVEDGRQVAPESVERLLQLLEGMYSNVIIDLPRSFNFFSSAAVDRADLNLVVAQLSVPSVRNAYRVYELLLQMGAEEDRIELVLNRYNADHERVRVEDVERHFGRPVFAKIPNDYLQVMTALDFGHPIQANAPTSPARVAIQEMAKKIAGEFRSGDAVASKGSSKKGLFQRIWGGR